MGEGERGRVLAYKERKEKGRVSRDGVRGEEIPSRKTGRVISKKDGGKDGRV